MEDRMIDFYRLPSISEYEEICLLTLRENCSCLEMQVLDILDNLPDHDRQVIESYIDMRNELEFETVKTALRWGKRHYN